MSNIAFHKRAVVSALPMFFLGLAAFPASGCTEETEDEEIVAEGDDDGVYEDVYEDVYVDSGAELTDEEKLQQIVESLQNGEGEPAPANAGMVCDGTFHWVDVLVACDNAYKYQAQVSACFSNICGCYECIS